MRKVILLVVFVFTFCSCLPMLADDKTRNEFMMKQFIKKNDKNKDGKIELKEVDDKGIRFFAHADTNCDETLTKGELDIIVEELNGNPTFYDKEKAVKPVENAKMHAYVNIPYAKVDDKNSIYTSLDIYKPANAEKQRVFVFVHGGAWAIGDKYSTFHKPSYFVGKNWVYVTINYRLVPSIKFPENIQDVANALAWVHDNIKDYGGDPEKIVIMGHSAGAHLVSLVATDESRLKKAKKDLSIIKAVISLDTNGYDIPSLTKERGLNKNLYEKAFGTDKEVQKEASPMTHVEKDKQIPPFILVHANKNEKKQESTETFAKALKDAGIDVTTIAAPTKTHGSLNQEFGKENDKETLEIMKKINEIVAESKEEK